MLLGMLKGILFALGMCCGARHVAAAEPVDPNMPAQNSNQPAASPPQNSNAPANASKAQDANAAVPAVQDANAKSQDANAREGDAQDAADPNGAVEAPPAAAPVSPVSQKKTLVISSNPVGAMVSIGDVDMGPTPLTVDRATLGDVNNVTVRWTRYNCDPHEMQVLLDPNVAEVDVGAYLYRRKQHALGAQYTGYFAGGIAHGANIFYRYYLPYHLFVTAGLGVTTTIGSTAKAAPLVLLGVGYDTGSSHDDPELPGLDRSLVAFTPSLEGELFGPPGLGAIYLYPVSVRAYYAFASFGIGYQFNHVANYSGFGCRLNVGAEWTFF